MRGGSWGDGVGGGEKVRGGRSTGPTHARQQGGREEERKKS